MIDCQPPPRNALADRNHLCSNPSVHHYVVEILANWKEAASNDENVSWARQLFASLHSFSSGEPNLNFPGLADEGPRLVRAAFGPQYERLLALKRKYDPQNLFRLNQNIL